MTDDVFTKNLIKFQVYGVKIGIRTEETELLKAIGSNLERVFPNGLEAVTEAQIEYHFLIEHRNGKFELHRNGALLCEDERFEMFSAMVESRVRLTIAEFAVEKVFLHAGVIGWKGRAIIIPATSFSGKSTLVAALVKKGALYYSDEYAVLDAEGDVEPFPKWLSLRDDTDDWIQTEHSVESLGGKAGREALPVGLVLISKYRRGKQNPRRWQPKRLTQGEAMMEIIPHTFPITNKPKFVLEVLNKMLKRAIIVRTIRGEAVEFAESLLGYFESLI